MRIWVASITAANAKSILFTSSTAAKARNHINQMHTNIDGLKWKKTGADRWVGTFPHRAQTLVYYCLDHVELLRRDENEKG